MWDRRYINTLQPNTVSPSIRRKGSTIQPWSSQMIPVSLSIPDPCFVTTSGRSPSHCPVCPEPPRLPTLCHLKRLEGQSFGFYLRSDTDGRGFEVSKVEPWSPAEHGGLREGDRVLEVNEQGVTDVEYHRVSVHPGPPVRLITPPTPFSMSKIISFNFPFNYVASPSFLKLLISLKQKHSDQPFLWCEHVTGGEEDSGVWLPSVPPGAEEWPVCAGTSVTDGCQTITRTRFLRPPTNPFISRRRCVRVWTSRCWPRPPKGTSAPDPDCVMSADTSRAAWGWASCHRKVQTVTVWLFTTY